MVLIRIILALLYALPALAQEGHLVDLGAHKLNMVCTGRGDARPVAILEAGGGGSSSIRACAYDRAGSGKSDPGPEPRTVGIALGRFFEFDAVLRDDQSVD